MARAGTGIFFDGKTSARQPVTVELDPVNLSVRSPDGDLLAKWPHDQLQHLSAPEGLLRLGRPGSLARLEVRDPALAAKIDDFSVPVDRSGVTERRGRRRVMFWAVAATASLIAIAVYGVPALADRIAPLIPLSVEKKLGEAVNLQVRTALAPAQGGKPFECGAGEGETPGRAALDKIVRKFEGAAGLRVPLDVVVVRRSQANAFAIPGGHVYVFEGLIAKSETPDELAGVIAHELGHVAHRDGTRSIIQAGGLSFLFGVLLGDFVGGGALVIATNTILKSSYSRDVETAADIYSVDLMTKVGADPRALGAILTRIAGAIEPGMQILLDHPVTKDRVRLIQASPMPAQRVPLLDAAEWNALKRICGTG